MVMDRATKAMGWCCCAQRATEAEDNMNLPLDSKSARYQPSCTQEDACLNKSEHQGIVRRTPVCSENEQNPKRRRIQKGNSNLPQQVQQNRSDRQNVLKILWLESVYAMRCVMCDISTSILQTASHQQTCPQMKNCCCMQYLVTTVVICILPKSCGLPSMPSLVKSGLLYQWSFGSGFGPLD